MRIPSIHEILWGLYDKRKSLLIQLIEPVKTEYTYTQIGDDDLIDTEILTYSDGQKQTYQYAYDSNNNVIKKELIPNA